jgi:hypothetical protein
MIECSLQKWTDNIEQGGVAIAAEWFNGNASSFGGVRGHFLFPDHKAAKETAKKT